MVAASPAYVISDGAATATITITLKDSGGDALKDRFVRLTQGTGHSHLSAASSPTDSNGVATFTSTDLTEERVTYAAVDESDNVTLPKTASVSFALAGDVNGDGQVNAVDALCVLRIVAGLANTQACPIPAPGNPDTDGDNDPSPGADPTDALCILRFVARLSQTQACGTFAASGAAEPNSYMPQGGTTDG